MKEQLREVYRVVHPPGGARQYLRRWITAAKRSRINAFVALAKRLEVYFEEIIAAIELGISNALIEGINAKIRLMIGPRLRTPLRPNRELNDLPMPRLTQPSSTISRGVAHMSDSLVRTPSAVDTGLWMKSALWITG